MTTEQKAKAYDEAVKRGSRLWESDSITRENYEYIFPELKESEDERIRKELISFFTERAKYTEDSTFNGFSSKEIIAWLEKQGEEKPTEEYNITGIGSKNAKGKLGEMIKNLKPVNEVLEQKLTWSEEDETIKNNISHIIRQYDKISKRENQPCYYVGDCLLWMQNIKDRVQPKQEWSEEDEKTLSFIIADYVERLDATPPEELAYHYSKAVNFLKFLRPQ